MPRRYTFRSIRPRFRGEADSLERQRLIAGFSQEALGEASVLLIGAGGINSQVAEGLVRKGVGRLLIWDGDVVELSNLNRQPFTRKHLGKPKPYALASVLGPMAAAGTTVEAYPLWFCERAACECGISCNLAVCSVDNDRGRVEGARFARRHGVPLVVLAVTFNADFGYCFVQEPAGACYGCLDPLAVNDDRRYPCVSGSSIDILKVVGGLALYAIDSLLMPRPRTWNYKEISLDGARPERQERLPQAAVCPICGGSSA